MGSLCASWQIWKSQEKNENSWSDLNETQTPKILMIWDHKSFLNGILHFELDWDFLLLPNYQIYHLLYVTVSGHIFRKVLEWLEQFQTFVYKHSEGKKGKRMFSKRSQQMYPLVLLIWNWSNLYSLINRYWLENKKKACVC